MKNECVRIWPPALFMMLLNQQTVKVLKKLAAPKRSSKNEEIEGEDNDSVAKKTVKVTKRLKEYMLSCLNNHQKNILLLQGIPGIQLLCRLFLTV